MEGVKYPYHQDKKAHSHDAILSPSNHYRQCNSYHHNNPFVSPPNKFWYIGKSPYKYTYKGQKTYE